MEDKKTIPQIEEEILKFWQENKIFEKSVAKEAPHGDYIFYDGPPFATGLPHYGHILSSVIKDVVPRYWTMKGYSVPRRWGWDCHGLPIENIVEKELKISGKKQIEKIGVDKFNETCRGKVLTYTQEWKKMVDRIGRWIEFDNSYKTMDSTYMESVWWAVKTIWDKGLIYEGRKVLMYCPRCETPVSKAEVAMDDSYKDVEDYSTVFKFRVKEQEGTYILAWSTTPWNKLVTYALAVNPTLTYVKVQEGADQYILAESRLSMLKTTDYKILEKFPGKNLVGTDYIPSYDFDYDYQGKRANYVIGADFVSAEEGTGVVTIAPYGEEDMEAIAANDLPLILHVDDKGNLRDIIKPWKGMYYRDVDPLIIDDLQKRGLVYWTKKEPHNYPFCWRCDTELFYNPIKAWFINIQKIKQRLIKLNEKINWYPEHLKHGRFLDILETAPDWNISRNRYWATPLPFWKCDNLDCGETVCLGSLAELQEKATNFNDVYQTKDIKQADIHKHLVDQIKLKCKCGSQMARVTEVIDCWVESGSMPFAEHHYPFENQEVFKQRFPGQYIAEYIAQTRAWFYYMHVMATLLFDDISFKNCVCTGTILNEKGEKLSKSKRNYTDPWEIINQYGVDSLRYYLMSSVVMQAENLFFSDKEVKDIYNKIINLLTNVLTFYQTFSAGATVTNLEKKDLTNVLDVWIASKLELLKKEVTYQMDNYNTVKATRPLKDFIDELSTWYVRRSRDRFKSDDQEEKFKALKTLRHVLINLAKLMAPFTPFIAETIWQELKGQPESVHLADWPKEEKEFLDEKVLANMELARKVVEAGLAARATAGLKIRQPLASYSTSLAKKLDPEYVEIIKNELNILDLKFGEDKLDTKLTPELAEQGLYRELVRFINALRKQAGLTIQDKVTVYYQAENTEVNAVFSKFATELKKDTLASEIKNEKQVLDENWQTKVKVNDTAVWLGLKK